MFENSEAYSGMSTNDMAASRTFYENVLGLAVKDAEMEGLFFVSLPGGGGVIVYPKPNHEPATFTILNFPVDDIDAAVDELVAAGVEILHYEGLHQDARGIMRGRASGHGPDQAWFADPAGNILSVVN